MYKVGDKVRVYHGKYQGVVIKGLVDQVDEVVRVRITTKGDHFTNKEVSVPVSTLDEDSDASDDDSDSSDQSDTKEFTSKSSSESAKPIPIKPDADEPVLTRRRSSSFTVPRAPTRPSAPPESSKHTPPTTKHGRRRSETVVIDYLHKQVRTNANVGVFGWGVTKVEEGVGTFRAGDTGTVTQMMFNPEKGYLCHVAWDEGVKRRGYFSNSKRREPCWVLQRHLDLDLEGRRRLTQTVGSPEKLPKRIDKVQETDAPRSCRDL